MNEIAFPQDRDDLKEPDRMSRPASVTADLWRSWMAILELHAKTRRRSIRISAGEYERLHRRLMEALDQQYENAKLSEAERGMYTRMREHCRPWVSLDPLKYAERRIVREVAGTAQCLYQEAFGGYVQQRRAASILLALAVLIAGGVLLVWLGSKLHSGDLAAFGDVVWQGVLGGWHRGVQHFRRLEFGAWIVAAVSLMLAIGILTLRSARSF